jgi:hypothetical protein
VKRVRLGKGKIWNKALAAVLIYWGLVLLEAFTFSNAGKILGVGALIAAALILIDK